jgi:hypothetical protein
MPSCAIHHQARLRSQRSCLSSLVRMKYFKVWGLKKKHTMRELKWITSSTKLWAGQPRNKGSILGKGKRFFSSLKRSDRLWGPPFLLFNWYRVKAAGTWNWPFTSGTKINNHRSCNFASSYDFISCRGVNFTFSLYPSQTSNSLLPFRLRQIFTRNTYQTTTPTKQSPPEKLQFSIYSWYSPFFAGPSGRAV